MAISPRVGAVIPVVSEYEHFARPDLIGLVERGRAGGLQGQVRSVVEKFHEEPTAKSAAFAVGCNVDVFSREAGRDLPAVDDRDAARHSDAVARKADDSFDERL